MCMYGTEGVPGGPLQNFFRCAVVADVGAASAQMTATDGAQTTADVDGLQAALVGCELEHLRNTLCDPALIGSLASKERSVILEHLRGIGVKKLGHRHKIAAVIIRSGEVVSRPASMPTAPKVNTPVLPTTRLSEFGDLSAVFGSAPPILSHMTSSSQEEIALRELPPESGVREPVFWPSPMPTPLLGLPWKGGGVRPIEGTSLARWQPWEASDAAPPPADAPAAVIAPPCCQAEGLAAASAPPPRLAVGVMLRAAPPLAVDGFLRYYHAIGFERIVLFFDKPSEDAEAIRVAKEHNAQVGGVTIHLCTPEWWESEHKTGRGFVRAAEVFRKEEEERRQAAVAKFRDNPYEATGNAKEDEMGKGPIFNLKERFEARSVHLVLQTNDVQARQQFVMDRACVDCWHAGCMLNAKKQRNEPAHLLCSCCAPAAEASRVYAHLSPPCLHLRRLAAATGHRRAPLLPSDT